MNQRERIAATASDSMPGLKWPSTRLLSTAFGVLELVLEFGGKIAWSDVTGCHATNYGSGPDYSELRVPRALFEFWTQARAFPAYAKTVKSKPTTCNIRTPFRMFMSSTWRLCAVYFQ